MWGCSGFQCVRSEEFTLHPTYLLCFSVLSSNCKNLSSPARQSCSLPPLSSEWFAAGQSDDCSPPFNWSFSCQHLRMADFIIWHDLVWLLLCHLWSAPRQNKSLWFLIFSFLFSLVPRLWVALWSHFHTEKSKMFQRQNCTVLMSDFERVAICHFHSSKGWALRFNVDYCFAGVRISSDGRKIRVTLFGTIVFAN